MAKDQDCANSCKCHEEVRARSCDCHEQDDEIVKPPVQDCANACGCQNDGNGILQVENSGIVQCSPVNFKIVDDCLPRLFINDISISFNGDLASVVDITKSSGPNPKPTAANLSISILIPVNQSTCKNKLELVPKSNSSSKASIRLCDNARIDNGSVDVGKSLCGNYIEIIIIFIEQIINGEIDKSELANAYGNFRLTLPRLEIARVVTNNRVALNCYPIKSDILVGGINVNALAGLAKDADLPDVVTLMNSLKQLRLTDPNEYDARVQLALTTSPYRYSVTSYRYDRYDQYPQVF